MPDLDSLPIIDAHQHFWDLQRNHHPWLRDQPWLAFRYGDYSPIRRTYLPPDYRRDALDLRIVGSVYVEAEWDPRDPLGETRYIEGLAAAHGLPSAIVAQAWLDAEDVVEVLAAQASSPRVRSVRHKPATFHSPHAPAPGPSGAMSDERWRAGYALLAEHGLAFDLQVPWWHLPEAARLARDFPRTTIIVNHTGMPQGRDDAALDVWRRALERIAREPNAALKISGLGQAGRPWRAEDNRRVVREAIEVFGVERCMFASNFPVDRLVADLPGLFRGFLSMVEDRPGVEIRALFHDNAARYYRIDDLP